MNKDIVFVKKCLYFLARPWTKCWNMYDAFVVMSNF